MCNQVKLIYICNQVKLNTVTQEVPYHSTTWPWRHGVQASIDVPNCTSIVKFQLVVLVSFFKL